MLICAAASDKTLEIREAPEGFLDLVRSTKGPERWRFIELTYYAYIAFLLQDARLLPRRVAGSTDDRDALRATLEAVAKLRWDAVAAEQLKGVLSAGRVHPIVVAAKQDPKYRSAITRQVLNHLTGPIRTNSKGVVDAEKLPAGFTSDNLPRRGFDDRGHVSLTTRLPATAA